MRAPATTFLCLLYLLGVATSTQAQGVEWEILNAEVLSLYRQGQYDRAVVVARKTLEVAEVAVGPNHPSVATSLNSLAAVYRAQGQDALAGPLYTRALAIQEEALGPDHPEVAQSLEHLAVLYRATKREKEADKVEQRAANIRAIKQ